MADILIADHQPHVHAGHSRSISGLDNGQLRVTAPKIEMVANPAFSFPRKPTVALSSTDLASRSTPLLASTIAAQTSHKSPTHKRAASALPTFSFNASDASGRHDEQDSLELSNESAKIGTTSGGSNRGHRRGASEFVGGDSRFGVSSAISSSPTKTTFSQLPIASDNGSPTRPRSHAHRRSVAVSSHDLSQIMSAAETAPRLSSSLPSSPVELPVASFQPSGATPPTTRHGDDFAAAEQHSRDASPTRPVSRPRVEFSEDVEIIPRPLSTISSETESSFSTIRGHTVNGSITSVLSFGSSSPASPRVRGHLDSALSSIAEPTSTSASPPSDFSKRLEREGQWLKSKTSDHNIEASEHTNNALDSRAILTSLQDGPLAPPAKRQKRQSLGQAFGFDRRRSEPAISVAAAEPTRLSAISLQDIATNEPQRPATAHTTYERRFSGLRLKQWVTSKLRRRSRDNINESKDNNNNNIINNVRQVTRPSTDSPLRPESAKFVDVPGQTSDRSRGDTAVAETDLDAVFGALDDTANQRGARPFSRLTFDTASLPSPFEQSASGDVDDESPMLDLDAATEPLRTPPLGNSHRRQLHSDRASKQPSASGGFVHRRAESEPALMTFSYNRSTAGSQKSMEDVFEEEEEEETDGDGSDSAPATAEERGMGITVVDADDGLTSAGRQSLRETPRPSTSYVSPTARLFVPAADRPASLMDEVIVEESSPVEEPVDAIEVVQAHEEPRASSLEKHSDSSEASTLLGASLSALPDHAEHTSPKPLLPPTFHSSELLRRQTSFETSRLGTSASSLADTRTTTSSCMTGDGLHDTRISVDDVPSLTSSRSTMLSTMHANNSRRDVSEPVPRMLDPAQVAARRKKRASIQSLSQLMGGTFGSKTKLQDDTRPQTASMDVQTGAAHDGVKKKDGRLRKLMFWRSRQSLREAAALIDRNN